MIGVPRVRLDVCCNDPDNGLFAHCAEGLQVTTWDGEDIEFECSTFRSPRFTEGDGRIRIARRWWPYLRSEDWYGNWCWNAYWLEPAVVVALLAAVKKARLFHCCQGPSGLYENWNDDVAPLDVTLWSANLWGRHSIGKVA